jgi:3-hydroxybutyryl-CoA dehydrogenase
MQRNIERLAVIGAGTMGTQIAAQAAAHGNDVNVYDQDPQIFCKSAQRLADSITVSNKKSVLSHQEWIEATRKVRQCPNLNEALHEVDLVIEACPEDVELKRSVFSLLDSSAPPHAILATNSSSIPISRIESATRRPEKCLNLHFYQLVMGMNIVDVMGGSKTTSVVIEIGCKWLRSIGCIPLTVKKEMLGFCFNSIWRVIKRQALHMWAGGYVDFRDIDRGWMRYFQLPQGPFGLMDVVGLDVIYAIEMVYYNESKDPKDYPPAALKSMIERNELGVKTGRGFYTYPDPEYTKPDFLTP